MEAWARAAGLNDEQTRALMKHHGGCPNTKDELTRTSQTLEGKFGSRYEMLEDQMCQLIMSRLSFFRMRWQDVSTTAAACTDQKFKGGSWNPWLLSCPEQTFRQLEGRSRSRTSGILPA